MVRTKPKFQTKPTEKVSDLVWFGSKPNQSNINRSNLVRFLVFNFEIQRTDVNLTSHFSNIVPPYTHF